MSSFNDLPDELFVKIFCYLDDHDPTKIRLERVSSRFFACLRESWKYSDGLLDFKDFSTTGGSAAFLERVPEITHLRLDGPENYEHEKVQQLYQNVHKMRVSTLEYECHDLARCFTNCHLFIWCLTNSLEYLENLDFECCDGYTCCRDQEQTCKTLDACFKLSPSCPKLESLRLVKTDLKVDSLCKELSKLTLKSLSLLDLGNLRFDVASLAQLLNSNTSLESLSVFADDQVDGHEEDFDSGEFDQLLNEGAGLELQSLKLHIFNFEYVDKIPTILKFLPKLRNLTVKFDWNFFYGTDLDEDEEELDDAKLLMEVIKEVVDIGKSKDFEIRFDLSVVRYRYKEYNFGEDFIHRLLARRGARTKRDSDGNKWEVNFVSDNVKVCIHTSIIDNYEERKKREEARKNKSMSGSKFSCRS